MKDRTRTSFAIISFGIFLILLGIACAIFTFVTIIGPILSLLLILLGCAIIWKSVRGEPPATL